MKRDLQYLTIGGHRYAIGLWWQIVPAAKGRKTLISMARERAKEFAAREYNMVALRQEQWGLAHAEEALGNCYPLAGAVRLGPKEDAFLHVFCLGEGLWWVLGITRGLIASEGDYWHATREDAMRWAVQECELISADIAVSETLEDSLAVLAPRLKPERALEPLYPGVSKHKNYLKAVVVAALALGLLTLCWWLYGQWQEGERERQFNLHRDAREKQAQDLREHPEKLFPMPWRRAPLVTPAGMQCARAMIDQPAVSLGWTLDELVCSPGAAIAVYRAHVKGGAFQGLPADTRLVTAQKSVLSVSLGPLPPRREIDYRNLPSRESVTLSMYELTQSLGANLQTLTWKSPAQITRGEVSLSCPWQEGTFVISDIPHVAIADGAVFQALEHPGLMLSTLAYDAKNQSWSIQGASYVLAQ